MIICVWLLLLMYYFFLLKTLCIWSDRHTVREEKRIEKKASNFQEVIINHAHIRISCEQTTQ